MFYLWLQCVCAFKVLHVIGFFHLCHYFCVTWYEIFCLFVHDDVILKPRLLLFSCAILHEDCSVSILFVVACVCPE